MTPIRGLCCSLAFLPATQFVSVYRTIEIYKNTIRCVALDTEVPEYVLLKQQTHTYIVEKNLFSLILVP